MMAAILLPTLVRYTTTTQLTTAQHSTQPNPTQHTHYICIAGSTTKTAQFWTFNVYNSTLHELLISFIIETLYPSHHCHPPTIANTVIIIIHHHH